MKLKLFLFVLSISLFGKSQTVTPVVIASDGGHYQSSGGSIEWTIGEPISETYTTSTNITTMGFHQPVIGLASMIQEQNGDFQILVYPNPVRDALQINFNGMPNTTYTVKLYDVIGKLILSEEANITDNNKSLNVKISQVAAATYYLVVMNKTFSKTIKINKINQ